jgi:hypothetical protein
MERVKENNDYNPSYREIVIKTAESHTQNTTAENERNIAATRRTTWLSRSEIRESSLFCNGQRMTHYNSSIFTFPPKEIFGWDLSGTGTSYKRTTLSIDCH